MTKAGRELSLAAASFLGAEHKMQFFLVAYSLPLLWPRWVSGEMRVLVRGYLGVHGWSVKGLLGSKSGSYSGVLGLRAVPWSSCVMSM